MDHEDQGSLAFRDAAQGHGVGVDGVEDRQDAHGMSRGFADMIAQRQDSGLRTQDLGLGLRNLGLSAQT